MAKGAASKIACSSSLVSRSACSMLTLSLFRAVDGFCKAAPSCNTGSVAALSRRRVRWLVRSQKLFELPLQRLDRERLLHVVADAGFLCRDDAVAVADAGEHDERHGPELFVAADRPQ